MEKLSLTDFYKYSFLSGLTFSPDGKKALFTVKKADPENNGYKSDLYLYDTTLGQTKRLTGLGDVGLSLWLDDKTVAFTAIRDEKVKEKAKQGLPITCFYKLSIDGGEAVEFLRLPYLVTGAKLAGNGVLALAVGYDKLMPDFASMTDAEIMAAVPGLKAEADYQIVDEAPFWFNGTGYTNGRRNEIYLCDLSGGKPEKVDGYPLDCHVLDIKDGKIMYLAQEYIDGIGQFKNNLYLYDMASKEKKVLTERVYSISARGFAGDRMWFAGSDAKEYGLSENAKLYFVDEDGKITLWLGDDICYGSTVGSDCRLGGGKSFVACDDCLFFTSTENYSSFINTVNFRGERKILPMESGSVDFIDKGRDGVYFIGMRGGRLQELYRFKDGKEEKLTSFNDRVVEGHSFVKPEHFVFENDGVELDGFVLKPVGYEEGKKYPGILDIHGGPKTVFGDVIYHEMQAWANMGYFVFFTNPRGGDGRGNEFADIRARYGKEDYSDIMKFTDEVIVRYPDIDPARLGVTGGSYGGFMTNWIIGHTDRFAAAASQRSISNWVSMGYIADIGFHFAADQTGATPWTDLDLMWEQSPLKYADKVKTPTLFIHSDQDYRCPLPEGMQMFTALKCFGVESRMCIFKGENHELSRGGKPLHRARRLKEITDWFEKYLKA